MNMAVGNSCVGQGEPQIDFRDRQQDAVAAWHH